MNYSDKDRTLAIRAVGFLLCFVKHSTIDDGIKNEIIKQVGIIEKYLMGDHG